MKQQLIILLLIIFIALLGIVLAMGRPTGETLDVKRALFDVALVVLGFSLAMGWDIFHNYLEENKEKSAIIIMLRNEIAENRAIVNLDLSLIKENQSANKAGKQVEKPLLMLNNDAWTSAKLRNNVFISDTADVFRFVNLYSAVHIINEKIRYREGFRMSNHALSNYVQIVSLLDNDIQEAAEKALPLIDNIQEMLDKKYPMRVEGKGFSINGGGLVSENQN